MEQYILKSVLVAEIKARISSIEVSQKAGMIKKRDSDKKILLLKSVLTLIDTLEVKEVNLDDFIKEEFNKHSCVDGCQLSVSYNMAEFYSMIKRLTKAMKGE